MRRADAVILGLVFVIAASPPDMSPGANLAEAACARRNPSLVEYTFDMNIAMRMRHFPWLRFGVAGTGQYVRGQSHTVRFTKMPFFAKGFHQIDLAPLDPCMWPKSYVVNLYGTADGATTFSLRPRNFDPRDTDPMVEALVTLDSADSTRKVVMHYTRGDIELLLTPAAVGEYRLPAGADVNINMPGQALSAHASLTNYEITRQTPP